MQRVFWGIGLITLGCTRTPAPSATASASASAAVVPATTSSIPEPRATVAGPPTARERDEPPEQVTTKHAAQGWIVDQPVELGPAAPLAAAPQGVVVLTKTGELALARRGPPPKAQKPSPTQVAALTLAPDAVYPRGPGPAVAAGFAYYTHQGKLLRRKLDPLGPAEVLATDARDGAAVTAVVTEGTPAVAAASYLSETPTRLIARVWIEGRGTHTLSPDGAAASSVSLATQGDELLAVSLEGRTGMSPLHARWIGLGATASPREDAVVWVGGSAQPTTQVAALAGAGDESWALLAIERDMTHFGLARIRVPRGRVDEAEVAWREYPNGVDPAPVLTVRVCDQAGVLYARPVAATPGAPQELHLAPLGTSGLGPTRVVAFAPGFALASIAALPDGVLVAYVAEGRSWAVTVRC